MFSSIPFSHFPFDKDTDKDTGQEILLPVTVISNSIFFEMGNHPGKSSHLMAITALANETSLDKKELHSLHKEFRRLAKKEGNDCTISKPEMKEALGLVGIIEEGIYRSVFYASHWY